MTLASWMCKSPFADGFWFLHELSEHLLWLCRMEYEALSIDFDVDLHTAVPDYLRPTADWLGELPRE